jgi:4,5-DOPA dioxygenase extradiol
MPAIFFGHGNPMNAIEDNVVSRAWKALGFSLPAPKAILSVSAHWYIPGTRTTAVDSPQTIHDFGGFPRALYEVDYPAPGNPGLARRALELLGVGPAGLDDEWGLDHGTWSVLVHAFPRADVPVVQLSIDESLSPAEHFELGKRLGPLRDEGVLVMGSGNLVHNLHAYAWGGEHREPYPWGIRFESEVRRLLDSERESELTGYESMGPDARLSAPTPDHFLPLLYVAALRRPGERVTYPVDGFDGGSVSMLTVRLG